MEWRELNLKAIEAFAKIKGNYQNMYSKTLFIRLLGRFAENLGITVSDEMLQDYSNLVRRQLNLYKVEDTEVFFAKLAIDQELWEKGLENELVRELLNLKFGNKFYLGDLWKVLRTIPEIRDNLADLLIARGKTAGIEIEEQELQAISDSFRRVAQLHSKDEFLSCLEALGLSLEGWEKQMEAQIYYQKLIEKNLPPLTSEDLLSKLGNNLVVIEVMNEMLQGELLSSHLKELELEIGDEEVQNYLDSFRRANKLHKSKFFLIWLKFNELSLEEFLEFIKYRLLIQKFNDSEAKSVNKEAIAKQLRVSKEFFNTIAEYHKLKASVKKAQELGIMVSQEELQEESDSQRRIKKLHNSTDFKNYLANQDLSLDDWSDFVEMQIYQRKLRDQLATDDKIIAYLEKNKVLRKLIKDDILWEWEEKNL